MFIPRKYNYIVRKDFFWGVLPIFADPDLSNSIPQTKTCPKGTSNIQKASVLPSTSNVKAKDEKLPRWRLLMPRFRAQTCRMVAECPQADSAAELAMENLRFTDDSPIFTFKMGIYTIAMLNCKKVVKVLVQDGF